MKRYTKHQKVVLQMFAARLFEVGFANDADLLRSSCHCCAEKRELLREIRMAFAAAKAGAAHGS